MADTITLPAVSLTDPWASLVVAGVKTLETRKGALLSGFSGPLVIHRTLAKPADYDLSRWGVTVPARPAGWPADDRGMALGIVYVERTWRNLGLMMWSPDGDAGLQRRACYHDLTGRYLSELTRATWFPAPIRASGQQTRWKIGVPRSSLPAWALGGAS